MKKTITSVTRCGECGALYKARRGNHPMRTYRDENREELHRYQHCSHSRPGREGPYHTEDLAHPVPTPWFGYLYGAQS